MRRLIIAVFALALLSGCAVPILKKDTIPVYTGTPPSVIALAISDHRPFILNKDKEEWFEGIFRGGFGIPFSAPREDEFKEKPFAFYLATKLKEAFENAGSAATIISLPIGTDSDAIAERIGQANNGFALAVIIHQSRYDIGIFEPEYDYHFELFVIDGDGRKLAQKSFQDLEKPIDASEKYNLFDAMAEKYKMLFDSFLDSPEIKNALTIAAGGN